MLDENNIEIVKKNKNTESKPLELQNGFDINVVYLDDDLVMLENFKTIYSPYFNIFTTDCADTAKEIIRNQNPEGHPGPTGDGYHGVSTRIQPQHVNGKEEFDFL